MSRTGSTIAWCAKVLPLITLIAVMDACSRDSRAADINRCVVEVQRETTQGDLNYLWNTTDSAEVRHDKIGGAVSDCMAKAGYGHSNREMSDAKCLDDVDFNPYCYRR